MNTRLLATEIVKTLTDDGYVAYFAGGWVRDYLLGVVSDDIDIATNASPENILALFPQTILVGLSFGVVIVVHHGHQFEVATFRRDKEYVDGRKPTSIEFSTPEEDASRRDFTINGMFYDPLEDAIYDYVHGRKDLTERIIRTIGDPYARLNEDRLRMVRAIRFSARFGFVVDPETQEAILANADSLFPAVAMERIWQEFVKMSKYPNFDHALIEMHRLNLLPTIFPQLTNVHLNDIKLRVAYISKFPKNMPTLWYLMELFPGISFEEIDELSNYLHTSKKEMRLAMFLATVQAQVQSEGDTSFDRIAWTYFYAHPASELALQLIGLKLPAPLEFFEAHQKRIKLLTKHIERHKRKLPLVNAAKLQEYGISPGIQMGLLLKEAERLTILHDCLEASQVIEMLKQTPQWIK